MADIVPDLDTLAGDCASPRHCPPRPTVTAARPARPLAAQRGRVFYAAAVRGVKNRGDPAAGTARQTLLAKLLDTPDLWAENGAIDQAAHRGGSAWRELQNA